MIQNILALPREYKKVIAFAADSTILAFSIYLALWLTSNYQPNFSNSEMSFVFATVLSSGLSLYLFGIYKAIHRFLAYRIFITITAALFISSIFVCYLLTLADLPRPFATAITFASFTSLGVTGIRLLIRQFIFKKIADSKNKVIIYGAGHAGVQLAASLIRGTEYYPVAFVDDETSLKGATISNLSVYNRAQIDALLQKYQCKMILLAIPSASTSRRKKILDYLEPFPVEIKSMPGISDIISGKAKIDELQDVDIKDLLGRESVAAEPKLLQKCISNQNVMVTGAGGSIGSELCRQIIRQKPKSLVLFELNEYSLYKTEQELQQIIIQSNLDVELIPVLGSVQNRSRITATIDTFNIDTIYHAAAYKHVHLVEQNIIEGLRNNIFGTLNCAQAAAKAKVKTFVLISTDKAVRPTNTMGASKRMAELTLQGLSDTHPETTFCMVRFGNVLGSSGSVVPLFRDQIKRGGPVTVTHPNIIRYFMTIPEAALLVIQASSMAQGGDVFVLDMGKPVLISDLAKKMIHLSGLEVKDENNPYGDIEIEFTGLRPGEKLYEELLVGGGNVTGTEHSRILRAEEKYLKWSKFKILLNELDLACNNNQQEIIRQLLIKAPTGFSPSSKICDSVYLKDGDVGKKDNVVVKLA